MAQNKAKLKREEVAKKEAGQYEGAEANCNDVWDWCFAEFR